MKQIIIIFITCSILMDFYYLYGQTCNDHFYNVKIIGTVDSLTNRFNTDDIKHIINYSAVAESDTIILIYNQNMKNTDSNRIYIQPGATYKIRLKFEPNLYINSTNKKMVKGIEKMKWITYYSFNIYPVIPSDNLTYSEWGLQNKLYEELKKSDPDPFYLIYSSPDIIGGYIRKECLIE